MFDTFGERITIKGLLNYIYVQCSKRKQKKNIYVKIAIILLGSYEYMPNAGKTSLQFSKK